MAPITRLFTNGIKAVTRTINSGSPQRRVITEIFDESGKKIISRTKSLHENSPRFRSDLTTYLPGSSDTNSMMVSRNLIRLNKLPNKKFLEEVSIKPPLTDKWGQTYLSNGAVYLYA